MSFKIICFTKHPTLFPCDCSVNFIHNSSHHFHSLFPDTKSRTIQTHSRFLSTPSKLFFFVNFRSSHVIFQSVFLFSVRSRRWCLFSQSKSQSLLHFHLLYHIQFKWENYICLFITEYFCLCSLFKFSFSKFQWRSVTILFYSMSKFHLSEKNAFQRSPECPTRVLSAPM